MADDDIPICSEEERWASPTLYAVMKQGRKSAVKICSTAEEAQALIDTDVEHLYLEVRPGVSRRCEDYCPVAQFCNWKERTQN